MKLCAACHQDLPKDRFSKKQWKLGAECQRRCTSCVRDNREVVQPPPPNNNNGPATNNNDGINNLLESMSMNDNEMIPLSDEELFKQPPPREDCPICFLMMPSPHTGHKYNTCCGKTICSGCVHAVHMVDDEEKCAFCRAPNSTSDKQSRKRLKNRMDMNDSRALHELAVGYSYGAHGLQQSYAKALELYHRAGELGYAHAYNNIGGFYINGKGVAGPRLLELRWAVLLSLLGMVDEKKAKYYLGLAAIKGDDTARNNLGILEEKDGNMDRALKHYMMSARGGRSESLEAIKELFMDGLATKEDYATALRAHQTYLDEICSDQRDKAAAYDKQYKYY